MSSFKCISDCKYTVWKKHKIEVHHEVPQRDICVKVKIFGRGLSHLLEYYLSKSVRVFYIDWYVKTQ